MTDQRFDSIMKLLGVIFCTGLVGIFGHLINKEVQMRKLELMEMSELGHFVTHAIDENVGVRRRLAEYFKTVTVSPKLRTSWNQYYALVNREYQAVEKEKQEAEQKLAQASQANQTDEEEELKAKIMILEKELKVNPRTFSPQQQIQQIPQQQMQQQYPIQQMQQMPIQQMPVQSQPFEALERHLQDRGVSAQPADEPSRAATPAGERPVLPYIPR